MWNLEKWYWWTCLQSRNRVTDVENKHGYKGGQEGWDKLGNWDWHICTTMYKTTDENRAYLVGQRVKNLPARGLGSIPGLGKSPEGGHGIPLQYSCLENPHGQRSLAGYSPQGLKESDTTEQLSTARWEPTVEPREPYSVPCGDLNRKEIWKEWICVHTQWSHFTIKQTLTPHGKATILQ